MATNLLIVAGGHITRNVTITDKQVDLRLTLTQNKIYLQ